MLYILKWAYSVKFILNLKYQSSIHDLVGLVQLSALIYTRIYAS